MTDATRRAFLGYVAYADIAPTLFPAALLARIRPGTAVIDVATIRETARLAEMNWTDDECREVAGASSSLTASVALIGKNELTNASAVDYLQANRRRGGLRRVWAWATGAPSLKKDC